MPEQKKFVTTLAMSPSATAHALGLSWEVVAAAIAAGYLGPVRVSGAKRRILVSDIERWVRTWPIAKTRTRKVSSNAHP